MSTFQVLTAKTGWLYIMGNSSSIAMSGSKDEVQAEIASLRVALQAAANNVADWSA